MGKKNKYFLFNKEQDYRRCFLYNMEFNGEILKAAPENKNQKSVIISRILDSKEKDMQWHQMFFEINNEEYISFKLSIFAANDIGIAEGNGGVKRLDDALMDPDISLSEKRKILMPYLKKEVFDMDDILLHDISGRYLWFMIEAGIKAGQKLEIKKIKICFPKISWISYLPEVYQNEDKNRFLERYLAVFQTLYEELNFEIERIPRLIDVESANKEFLNSLSEWMGLENAHMWQEGRLRELLKNFLKYYRIRGNKESVKMFVRLYTNSEMVYIVENFELEGYLNKKELERLYGNDPYSFCVIIKEEQLSSGEQYRSLLKIIEEAAPANMRPELIVLKPYIFLSRHSYMEINSVLGGYRDLSLSGLCELEYSLVGSVTDGQKGEKN